MKYVGSVFLILATFVAGGGCRMCNDCYPFGGLIGKEGARTENGLPEHREGSVLDGPAVSVETFDEEERFIDAPAEERVVE